jgi:hypothetical protein
MVAQVLIPRFLVVLRNSTAAGTMARGAGESGQVETYMCTRIRVHPRVGKACIAAMLAWEGCLSWLWLELFGDP